MTSKHLIDSPSSLVIDALEGLCALNPSLRLDREAKVLYQPTSQAVSLICGGGAGHEPAHAGYVGQGILTAAVSGNVFASPSGKQVRRAVELVHPHGSGGTLIIVKNYTGDVLNFGLAKEGLGSDSVRFVNVADDVSVPRSRITLVGRRGLAGTVLVYKIAGALAAENGTLDQVESVAQFVASHLATVGVATGHSHVPGTEPPSQDALGVDEIEVGMGIHNEPGVLRLKGQGGQPPSLSEIIPKLLTMLTATKEEDPERGWVDFSPGTDVVLLVNNLGAISPLELSAVSRAARNALEQLKGLNVKRVLCGTYMTSLNMPGFSITLLKLPSKSNSGSFPSQDLLLSLLDAPAEASGWGWVSQKSPVPLDTQLTQSTLSSDKPISTTSVLPSAIVEPIRRACQALIKAEPELTRMDTIAGDGDCGLTLKAGAEGVLSFLSAGTVNGSDLGSAAEAAAVCSAIAGVAEDRMGGTSGGLYSIFFSALAQGLRLNGESQLLSSTLWPSALQHALTKLYTYTRARPPSRTLVDPLDAFVSTLIESTSSNSAPSGIFEKAFQNAEKAAQATKGMQAKAGRAVYVGEGEQTAGAGVEAHPMDPGAWGVVVILRALVLGDMQ